MTRQELNDFIITTLLLGFMLGLIALVVGLPIYYITQLEQQQSYLQSVYERIN
jgi:hypothetical protein